MSPPSATSSIGTNQSARLIERAQAMPKQGASSGFKYGRAVGAIEAAIALCAIPVDHRRAVGLETVLATPRQGQGKRAAASAAAVSGRACGARAQERPWPGRGGADRAATGPSHERPAGAGSFAIRRQRRGARFALPGVRRPRREGARASAQVLRLCRSRHGAPRGDGPADRATNVLSTSLVGETIDGYTITRDDVENALRPASRLCGCAPRYARGRVSTSNSASTFPTIAGAFGTADLIVRIGNTIHVIDFKFGCRRARPRALSRRRRGRHQRAAAVLRRGRAPLASRILCRRRRHRSDDPAAAVDRARRRDGVGRHGDARRAR